MARRYFNWKLAVVILLATMMLGVTAYGLRKWQKGEKSEVAYEKGIKAFDEHKWDVAAANLGRYISSNPEDIEMIHKYATAQLNKRPVSKGNINQATGAYRMILRADKSDFEATKKISEIYLQMHMSGEAELILSKFPDIASNPDLSTMLAMAMSAQKKFEDAAKQLNTIIEEYPEHIKAYAVLAQLAVLQPEIVTKPMEYWIDLAVEENPKAVNAYLMRANYRLGIRDKEGFNADLAKVRGLEITELNDKLTLTKLLIVTGKLEESEKLLEEIAASDPQSFALWSLWVDLAKRSNSKDKVLEVVENAQKALELDPWDFMPTAAEIYLQYNMLDEAKDCISKLKDKKMNPLTVARFDAMITDTEGEPFESIKAWREAKGLAARIKNTSLMPKIRISLALAYFRADDSAAAVRELKEITVDNPTYWQGHLLLAKNAYKNGDMLQASECSRRVLQLVPGHVEASSLYTQAGVRLLTQSKNQASPSDVEALEKQIAELAMIPSMAIQAELLRFRMAIGNADLEAAEKIADKLKSDYPDDIRAAIAKANLYSVQDKPDKTIAVLEQMVKDFPTAAEPVQYLVSILAGRNEQEKCIALVNEAIERNNEPGAKMNLSFLLADIYLKWNRQDELYGLLETLSSEHPKNVQVKTRLLLTQKISGDPVSGQSIVDQVKAIAGAESWQWRYHQSRLWYLSEDFKSHYTEIVSFMKKNLLENPTDRTSRLLLAASYFKKGAVQLAFSMYREAYDRDPDNPKVILPMVSALYQAGQYEQADEIMSKVSKETMRNPRLSRLKVDSHIRQGDYSTASDLLRSSLLANSSSNSDKFTLAMLEMEQKNYSESAKMLENLKSTVTEPGFLRSVVVAQIQLNLQQNNSEEAIKICNKLVEENSDAASLLIRARTYYTIKDNEKALADYNLAIEKEAENPDVWIARSRFYVSTKDTQKAIDDILKAHSLDETDALMQKQAVALMLASGIEEVVKGGRQLLEKSLKYNPGNVELMMINARLLFSRGTVPSRNESAATLVEITRKEPAKVEAWSLLGQIALDRRQYDKAIAYAQRGLLSRPNDRSLLLLKARGESGKSPAFAIMTLKTLYDLEPDNLENAIYLADTYSRSEQTRKAVDLLETQLEKIEDQQDSLKCRVALAQARYRDGKIEQAAKEFEALMESKEVALVTLVTYTNLLAESRKFDECFSQISDWIAKDPKESLAALGVIERLVNINSGNTQIMKLAISVLEKVTKANPDSTNALQAMAVVYQMTGQNDKAISFYEKIYKINPDDVIILNNLAWAYCQKNGNFKQALEMAHRGLKKAPDYIDLIDTRGFIYMKLGQYDKAIDDFQKCLELYPKANPARISTRLHLAKAFEKAGQKELAIKELNAILLLKQDIDANIREIKKADFKEAMNLLNTLSKRG